MKSRQLFALLLGVASLSALAPPAAAEMVTLSLNSYSAGGSGRFSSLFFSGGSASINLEEGKSAFVPIGGAMVYGLTGDTFGGTDSTSLVTNFGNVRIGYDFWASITAGVYPSPARYVGSINATILGPATLPVGADRFLEFQGYSTASLERGVLVTLRTRLVPEPSGLALMGLGALGAIHAAGRRRAASVRE